MRRTNYISNHLKSRRVWIGIADSSSPYHVLDSEACVVLEVWSQLLVSTPFTLSMTPAAHVDVTATADAIASQNLAGLGGVAFFPNGCEVWYQSQITLSETQCLWDWVGDDMQKHIAAWDLLAQFALTFCIESCLPRCRGPVSCQ